jgi:hypothetical protein
VGHVVQDRIESCGQPVRSHRFLAGFPLAWTMLSGRSREALRSVLALDSDTWARGRGWALWKALLAMESDLARGDSAAADGPRTVIREVLVDHERSRLAL